MKQKEWFRDERMSRGGRNRRKSRDRNPQQQRSEGRQKDWNRNPQKQNRGKRRRREERKPQQPQARQPQAEPQSLADRFRKGKETQEVARVERQKRWAKGRIGDVAEKAGQVAEATRPVGKAVKVVGKAAVRAGKAAVQVGKAAAPHVKVAGVAVVKALDKATAPPKSGKRPQFPDMLGDREPRRVSPKRQPQKVARPVWSIDMGMGAAPSTPKKKKGKKPSTTLDLNQGGMNFNF
ncbi:MAG: hypothetical protein WC262_10700 [Bacteroidales bacterium]